MCPSLVPRAYRRDVRVYQVAKRVDPSNDALVDLLESIESFLKRVAIYTQVPPTAALDEMVVKIMMESLSTIALATKEFEKEQSSASMSLMCYITQWITVRLIRRRFGEKEVEAVLRRLDRLTEDETRTTAAEILKVVHGLVQNMNIVMGSIDGKRNALSLSPTAC